MSARPFHTLLVANRGEIACRVLRTAKAMGYRTVAVFSDADRDAPHMALADEAVHLGPAPAAESYLDPARLLAAARRAGADALHPGYGFLSENADFARAVQAAGLVWVGPPPDAMEAMGDKARARRRMAEHGVPCVPGFDAEDPDDATLVEAAERVGWPLLVKASAGGGGRGMRRVEGPEGLAAAIAGARAEAASAFGSGRLLLERYVERGRHVEVQVFGDSHGEVIHLGERDCSVQRRHQKVVEEAPSPAVDAALRQRMGEAAVRAARAVGYEGAGTVEFLLGEGGEFYFLEMNTRLQVEHPVTELVTGLDLVEWQLRVASGERLPLRQEQVALRGHAIEVRLYAEDPAKGYLPQTGRVVAWVPPEGVRVDHGLRAGMEITPYYDAMVAKLVAWAPERAITRRKLGRALDEAVLFGLRHNAAFLGRVLDHPTFAAGEATTTWLGQVPELGEDPPPDAESLAVAVALVVTRLAPPGAGLRNAHPADQPVCFEVDGRKVEVVVNLGRDGLRVRQGGAERRVAVLGEGARRRVDVDGHQRDAWLVEAGGAFWVRHRGDTLVLRPWDPSPEAAAVAGDGTTRAPTAGRVLSVAVEPGQRVELGAALLTVEAMKLESTLRAGVAGVVTELRVRPGATVAAGQVLVVLTPEAT